MTTREIITLQFGHYANYVGTHWWNLQESNFSYDSSNPSELNHDVLYREGESPGERVTFTPRLLLVDLKGSLGYLNEQGFLYDNPLEGTPDSSHCLWDQENVEITSENTASKNSFLRSLDGENDNAECSTKFKNLEDKSKLYNLDSDVNSWVDYLVSRFHPRTVNIVHEYKHQCTNKAFDIFNYGKNVWTRNEFKDDFSDRIRQYAEECDSMQGFQILLNCTDGFGGLATSCIEHLHDEYGKSILAFPLVDSTLEKLSAACLVKSVNIALCWQQLGEHASLFSPLCCGDKGWPTSGSPRSFANLSYNNELKYHTSAILATALDTLSIRYRHKMYSASSLSDLCADLNKFGRKAAATSLSLPFPMTVKMDLIDVLDNMDGPLWTCLSPNCEITEDKSMHSLALRGISEDRLKRTINEAKKQMSKPAYRCSSVHEMMTMYIAYTCHASATYLSNIKAPLKVPTPYPRIFNNNVHKNGDVAAWPVGEDVESIPVLAGLHSGSKIGDMFESLHGQLSKIRSIKKFHSFENSGLEQDDFNECLSYLLDSKEAYEDHYV